MAKIQFGSGIAAISGRTAGTVYSRNKGGAYMRRFSVPTNPGTVAQDGARNRLSTGSALWRTITAVQRDSWNAYALTHPVLDRLGASIILTGHQLFVRVLANDQLTTGLTTRVTPPIEPVFKSPIFQAAGITMAAAAGTLVINAGVALAITDYLQLWASPPVSPGVSNTRSAERMLATFIIGDVVAAEDPILDIVPALYTAVFGAFTTAAAKKVNFAVYHHSNGVFGPREQQSVIIAA